MRFITKVAIGMVAAGLIAIGVLAAISTAKAEAPHVSNIPTVCYTKENFNDTFITRFSLFQDWVGIYQEGKSIVVLWKSATMPLWIVTINYFINGSEAVCITAIGNESVGNIGDDI